MELFLEENISCEDTEIYGKIQSWDKRVYEMQVGQDEVYDNGLR